MLETTSFNFRLFGQWPDEVLADFPLKRHRRLLILLTQNNIIYAQVLNSKSQVIQEIAEQNIYFGIGQRGYVIQALRNIPSSDIQPTLKHHKLKMVIGEEKKNSMATIKDILLKVFTCCCPCLSEPYATASADPLGTTTNPSILSFCWTQDGLKTRSSCLITFKEEALKCIERLSNNPTQESDELQDTLTLIESLCPKKKKQILKNYCENLDSILKNEEETKKLKTFLENII